ncbi:MAG: DNA-directed polymerase sigma-70 factor [Polaromonas sp.]|nr:DNA-directed polymerase sigma-70 factor [Polaromonas sp.]
MSTSPEDLAGEYVLGTLSAAQRRSVEQRLPHEPALRAAVQAWQEQLLPLAALAPPVEPSARLWQRIENSLAPVAATATAAAHAPARRPSGRAGWWDSVRLWRGLAGTGFAAAAVLASVLVLRQGALPAAPQYMVVLVGPQDKAPGWVIQASSPQQLSLIPLGQTAVPAEKSLQFWTKGDNWTGPVSLGLVKPGQTVQIPLDKLPPLQPNQLFELTLEPVNGSPLNRPTGPIQFIGRAVKVI